MRFLIGWRKLALVQVSRMFNYIFREIYSFHCKQDTLTLRALGIVLSVARAKVSCIQSFLFQKLLLIWAFVPFSTVWILDQSINFEPKPTYHGI